MPNFIVIAVYYYIQPHITPQKMTDVGNILGLLYPHPWTDLGHIWPARVVPRFMLICQISSLSVHCIALETRNPPQFHHFVNFVILH